MSLSTGDDSNNDFVDIGDEAQGVVEALCVEVNQTGTRVAVGHTKGFILYAVRRVIPAKKGGGAAGDVAPPLTNQLVEVLRFGEGPSSPRSTASTDDDWEEEADDEFVSVECSRSEPSGVGGIALLFETTTLAVVGGGPRPLGDRRRLHIFQGVTLATTITLGGDILRVVLANTCAFVLTTDRHFTIVGFDGTVRQRMPTHILTDRPTRPLAVNTLHSTVAFPGAAVGSFGVATFRDIANVRPICDAIKAHSHAICCLALSEGSEVCVSSSVHGTLIRVWAVSDATQRGAMLAEVRTSAVPIRILLASVSACGRYLFALLNGCAIGIFFIGTEEEAKPHEIAMRDSNSEIARNQKSVLSSFSFLSQYLDSSWAVCCTDVPRGLLPNALAASAGIQFTRQAPISASAITNAMSAHVSNAHAPSTAAWGWGLLHTAASYATNAFNGRGGYAAATDVPLDDPVSRAPPATENGTTAEDILAIWWERPGVLAEMVAPTEWSAQQITDFSQRSDHHRARAAAAAASTLRGSSAGQAPPSATPRVTDVICIANGQGDLMRVEFSAVGGRLVPLPIVSAQQEKKK